MRKQHLESIRKKKQKNYNNHRQQSKTLKQTLRERKQKKYTYALSIIKSLPNRTKHNNIPAFILTSTKYNSPNQLPPYISNGEYDSFYHVLYDYLYLTLFNMDLKRYFKRNNKKNSKSKEQ